MVTEAPSHKTHETKETDAAHLAHESHLSHACPPRHAPFAESAKLEQAIQANMRRLGYGG